MVISYYYLYYCCLKVIIIMEAYFIKEVFYNFNFNFGFNYAMELQFFRLVDLEYYQGFLSLAYIVICFTYFYFINCVKVFPYFMDYFIVKGGSFNSAFIFTYFVNYCYWFTGFNCFLCDSFNCIIVNYCYCNYCYCY